MNQPQPQRTPAQNTSIIDTLFESQIGLLLFFIFITGAGIYYPNRDYIHSAQGIKEAIITASVLFFVIMSCAVAIILIRQKHNRGEHHEHNIR